jgi:hypothetical protein
MEQMADAPPTDAAERGERFIRENYDRRAMAATVEELLSSLVSRRR